MVFKSHDTNINYDIIGTGLPIIMIHGNGPDHRSLKGCMEPCFKDLDFNFKRIYFDLPGFGKSKGSKWLSDANKMLQLIIEFINEVIPREPFLLVGNSYGGYLARGILKKQQHLVKGLFLLCPSLNRTSSKPKHLVLEKELKLDHILSYEEKSYFKSVAVRQTLKVWDRFSKEILPGLKLKDHTFFNTWRKNTYSFNIEKLDRCFEKPVLIVTGKQDSIVGYSDSFQLLKDYPRATLSVVDEAGHILQIEQSVLFNSLTIEWLERIISIELNNA